MPIQVTVVEHKLDIEVRVFGQKTPTTSE